MMTRERMRLLLLLLLSPCPLLLAASPEPGAPAASKPAIETGPALGWVFPLFTDKEGYRLLTLRGSAAQIISADEIEVTGFSAVAFSGDATERVDTVLLSPKATFRPKENRASGDSPVRLILAGRNTTEQSVGQPSNDDIEVTGVGWTYDHAAKKVSLAHNVRVTFQTQLNDILK